MHTVFGALHAPGQPDQTLSEVDTTGTISYALWSDCYGSGTYLSGYRMANVYEKLELAERIETTAALIYEALRRHFLHNARLAKTFKRLAEEEHQHALRVRMLRSTYVRSPRAFAAIDLDTEEVRRVLSQAETALATIESAGAKLSATEATQLVIALERGFAKAHAHVIAKTHDAALEDFFADLAKQDEAHAALLEDLKL